MFGYVKVYSPEMKVWENELYKSIYCSLCKFGGKQTTRLSRFLLSYDFVALATARMILTEEKPEIIKSCCPYLPKKKNMVSPCSSIEYTSDAFVILTYYKLLDNKKDTKGIKKILSTVSPVLLKSQAKKANERQKGLADEIVNQLSILDKEEKQQCISIDKVADCFAVILGHILSFGLENSKKRIAYEIGYHMGRYIYIIDALDDFKKDIKEKNYNPLVSLYTDCDNLKNNIEIITSSLRASLNRVKCATELLESSSLSGIIDNIVGYGADSVISKVVSDIYKE